MTLALLTSGLAVATVLVSQASRPASRSSRRRAASRRARFVALHPTQVNSTDVVAALRRAGLDRGQAHAVVDHALARGVRPFTMWLCLEHLGAEEFCIAVAADLTQRDLLTHLSDGTVPDAEELKLFASANGLNLSALSAVVSSARTAVLPAAPRGAAAAPAPLRRRRLITP